MGNPNHVKLIKKGVAAWNTWRVENPDIAPDLTKADLRGASLAGPNLLGTTQAKGFFGGVNLSDANLSEANLHGANLGWVNLSRAVLYDTNLSRANLSGALLYSADLSRADLSWANLSGAFLHATNLSRADLSNANLESAKVGWAIFGDNNLSTVKGLETIIHGGPSTIGVDTLYKSGGKIPEVFLRAAGVPEDFITFIPSLVGRAIEFYSCFISHSHQDEEFSRRLHSRMQDAKLRVWYAPEDMKGGKKLHEEIFSAIQVHDKLLLVLSDNSMKSEWVITEIRRAKRVEREENRRKLFPIRLVGFDTIQEWECFDIDSGKDLAVELREYYIPDFSNWQNHDSFEKEFAKLLRDMKATEV